MGKQLLPDTSTPQAPLNVAFLVLKKILRSLFHQNVVIHTYIHTYIPDWNGDGPKVSSEDGNGDEGNGNEGRVGDGEKEAKKRKKPLNSCRRQGGNGGDFGGTRKRCRKGSVGPVAANSNIVEINKEAGGGAQGTLSLSKNCTSRESVSPLSRLIRGFRNKYH